MKCKICGSNVEEIYKCKECKTAFCEKCGDSVEELCEYCLDEEEL